MASEKKARIHLSEIIPEELSGISFEFRIVGKGQLGSDGNPVSHRTVIDNRGKLRLQNNDGTDVPLDQIPDILTGKNAEVVVRNDGVTIGQGRILNFIPGSGTIISIASTTGSVIDIEITAGGAGAVHTHVFNEVLTGDINGSNQVFTTLFDFRSGTTQLYRNNIRQMLDNGVTLNFNYSETGSNEITYITAPKVGDNHWIDYIKD